MIVGLVCAVVFMAALMLAACWRIEVLQQELRDQEEMTHAKCIAHIASVVSNHAVAEALRQAADRYDSVENQSRMYQITRSWSTASPASVPSIWLRQEADRIEATTPKVEATHAD